MKRSVILTMLLAAGLTAFAASSAESRSERGSSAGDMSGRQNGEPFESGANLWFDADEGGDESEFYDDDFSAGGDGRFRRSPDRMPQSYNRFRDDRFQDRGMFNSSRLPDDRRFRRPSDRSPQSFNRFDDFRGRETFNEDFRFDGDRFRDDRFQGRGMFDGSRLPDDRRFRRPSDRSPQSFNRPDDFRNRETFNEDFRFDGDRFRDDTFRDLDTFDGDFRFDDSRFRNDRIQDDRFRDRDTFDDSRFFDERSMRRRENLTPERDRRQPSTLRRRSIEGRSNGQTGGTRSERSGGSAAD